MTGEAKPVGERSLGGVSLTQLWEARRKTRRDPAEELSLKIGAALFMSDLELQAYVTAQGLTPRLKVGEMLVRARDSLMTGAMETAPPGSPRKASAGEEPAAPPTQAGSAVSAAESAAVRLKLSLAVRGWARPRELMPTQLDEADATKALALVALEVETAVEREPGKWYLRVSSRRRLFATNERSGFREVIAPVSESDSADPVRKAFAMLLAEPPVEADAKTDLQVLRALRSAADWMGDGDASRQERIGGLVEFALRQQDVFRLARQPLVGRDSELLRLVDFLRMPRDGWALNVLELFGLGGSGKSTLLAHVQAQLESDVGEGLQIIYLDFDRHSLNPEDPISLDLALLDSIAAARPERAENCARISRDLAELRRSERADQVSLTHRQRPHRKSGHNIKEQYAMESLETTSDSRRFSVIDNMLAGPPGAEPLRLALILDTLENVLARGTKAALGLAQWLHSLSTAGGAWGTSVILSGRDPPAPDRELHIPTFLRDMGHNIVEPPVELKELESVPAIELLRHFGVSEAATAAAAVDVLPRLPLLLRIAADVLTRDPKLAAQVREEHSAGRVDSATAQQYLATRLIKHVRDPSVRDYVVAALILPEVTRALVRKVVVPIVDARCGRETEPGRASRVYSVLSEEGWLTRVAPDQRSFSFHPAIRRLALKLIGADPADAELERAVREAAIAHHQQGRSNLHRAFANYHRLMLGRPAGRIADRSQTVNLLGPFVDDLPEAARNWLLDARRDAPAISREQSDEEWRAYLEGIGGSAGFGRSLVQRGEAERALEMYRRRPTRAAGNPPDFVIQALAETGQWDDPLFDAETVVAILDECMLRENGTVRLPPTLRSRLFWATRLSLLRDPRALSEPHAELLIAATAEIKAVKGDAAFPAIVAAAEAFQGRRIGPPHWLSSRGAIGRVTRYPLVQSLVFRNATQWRSQLDALIVLQRDWAARVAGVMTFPYPSERAAEAQSQLDALHGAPLYIVSNVLRSLRVLIDIPTAELNEEALVLLLRGKTTEFLRPLAWAAARHVLEHGQGAMFEARDAAMDAMSIRVDFGPSRGRPQNAGREPQYWHPYIDIFDQARVLPVFCKALVSLPGEDPETARLRRIAMTFLEWDRALCGGGSSAWNFPQVPAA